MSETLPEAPAERLNAGRMRQLAWFRTLSLALQGLAVLISSRWVTGAVPGLGVYAVLGANLSLLALVWWRTQGQRLGYNAEVFAHLLADQVSLFLLVTLIGGVTNPFVMLLLLPLALAAVLLPGRYVVVLLLVAVFGYLGLLIGSDAGLGSQEVLYMTHMGHASPRAAYSAHLRGMWIAFTLAALLLSFFVYWTASALRYREGALRRLQMQRLRDDKLLALGAQAATAAHELGTPVSTARMLCEELQTELPAEQQGALADLENELQRSSDLLRRLAEQAHQREGDSVHVDDLAAWLREQVEAWRALRPGIAPFIRVGEGLGGSAWVLDEGIPDALGALLNNAADASPAAVGIEASAQGAALMLDVVDRGPGFTPAHRDSSALSEQGLGMGVLLAGALVERAGGRLEYLRRDNGGTRARIRLNRAGVDAT